MTHEDRRALALVWRTRWTALGYRTQRAIGDYMGVASETVRAWCSGKRPLPAYAWRALQEAERIYGKTVKLQEIY